MSFAVTLLKWSKDGQHEVRSLRTWDKILSKVNSGSSLEAKLSALSTVTTVINAAVGMKDRGEFASALQSETLATAVTAELVKLGKMLLDSDIEGIRTDNELCYCKAGSLQGSLVVGRVLGDFRRSLDPPGAQDIIDFR
jgi:hypothetical protein